MSSAALVRWILLRLVRSPTVGFLGLSMLLGLPILFGLRPLPTPGTGLDLALAWAFPAALVGVGVALWTLSEGAAFLQRLDPVTRGLGEWGALTSASLYLQLPILASALLSGASPADLGRALPAILTTDLFLASVALLTLLPDLAPAVRTSLFLGAVWILPALATTDGSLAPYVSALDVRSSLRAETLAASVRLLPAAVALALASHLLRTAPARAVPK
jgi:hypothetical protein